MNHYENNSIWILYQSTSNFMQLMIFFHYRSRAFKWRNFWGLYQFVIQHFNILRDINLNNTFQISNVDFFFHSHCCMKCCSEGICNFRRYFVIFQKINDAIMKEYLDRVFGAISTNTELENLQPGIGEYKNLRSSQSSCCDDPTTAIIIFGIIKCLIV